VFGAYEAPAGARPVIGQALSVVYSEDALGQKRYAFKPA
jgi:hypothetical protein